MNMGDSRVLHLCVENDALVTNGLRIYGYDMKLRPNLALSFTILILLDNLGGKSLFFARLIFDLDKFVDSDFFTD